MKGDLKLQEPAFYELTGCTISEARVMADAGGREDQSLNKSLEELFKEAIQADADSITFTSGSSQIRAAVLKNRSELKTCPLDAALIKPLCLWFYDHYAPLWTQDARPSEGEAAWKFKASVRLEQTIIKFDVSKSLRLNGSTHISLSEFSIVPVKQALECFYQEERQSLLEALDLKHGIFLLSSPTTDGLNVALGVVRCLAGFNDVNIIMDLRSPAQLPVDRLNVVCMRADDPADAILRTKEAGADFEKIPLLGSLCYALVRKICASCAREAAIDPSVVSHLHPVLRNKLHGAFRIGRGCTKCGHSGYEGLTGIRSFIRGGTELDQILSSSPTHSGLVDFAYKQGAVSLFEDGLEKVNHGITSLEALYNGVKVLPEVYLKHIHHEAGRKSSSEKPLALPDDFFVSQKAQRPVTGNQALAKNPDVIPLPLDEPVLDLNEKIVRDKRLILIAEDDADQRSILEMLFRGAGYDVAVASDGVEALEKLEEMEPDIIISDLMMPRMDGGQLVRKIRTSGKFTRLPVLMLTVVSDVQKEYELLDLGADDYCEKTIQRKILLKRVENLLKRA